MSECDSCDHPVFVVVVVVLVVVVVVVNFLLFRLLINRCTYLLQILCGYFLVWTRTKFVIKGDLPLFHMELWIILYIFLPIIEKFSIKPLTRNHSYLVWRVTRGANF